jgi:uncharacterized protein
MGPAGEDPRERLCRELAEATTASAFAAPCAATPSHDLDHVRRVVRLARRIARAEGADEGLAACAAWLHDIERAAEDRGGPDHALAGAQTARRLLALRPELTAQEVEAVADAIARHRFRSRLAPSTPLARCLYDADKLDAMGAVGIGRAYMMAGEQGQRLHTRVPDGAAPRHMADIEQGTYSPVEEWTVKLRHLEGAMTTAEGRRLASARADFMEGFFARLEEEVSGEG